VSGPASESLVSPRLWLAFLAMLLVTGLANTFPVFFPALLAEYGGSRAATAAAVTLLWTGGAVMGPLAGWWVSRGSPRLVVIAGFLAAAAGLGLGAAATSLGAFTLAVGIGVGIGVGLTGMVAQAALVADAYVRRRGVAMGIVLAGSMAGYVVAPPVQWGIARFGWRGALADYAAAILLLVPVAWWVLPARLRAASAAPGTDAGSEPTVRDVVRSAPFWVLAVLFATPPLLGYLATTQHAVYFTGLGFSAAEASAMLGVGGVLAASGRVLFGLLADRIGAAPAGFLSFGATLAGMLCLLATGAWPGRTLAYGYVLFLFLPMGSRATIVSVLVSRIAPPRHYGLIFGLLGVGNSLGAAAGPLLSGAIYDWTGSYRAIYLTATAILLVGIAALALFSRLTRPAAGA
jgi:MFS family permease